MLALGLRLAFTVQTKRVGARWPENGFGKDVGVSKTRSHSRRASDHGIQSQSEVRS